MPKNLVVYHPGPVALSAADEASLVGFKFFYDFQTHHPGIEQIIPGNYDSRKVVGFQGTNDHSVIHVIKNPSQILPYCVIILEVSFNVIKTQPRLTRHQDRVAQMTSLESDDKPEADSLNKKVMALQWQFVKARLLE